MAYSASESLLCLVEKIFLQFVKYIFQVSNSFNPQNNATVGQQILNYCLVMIVFVEASLHIGFRNSQPVDIFSPPGTGGTNNWLLACQKKLLLFLIVSEAKLNSSSLSNRQCENMINQALSFGYSRYISVWRK